MRRGTILLLLVLIRLSKAKKLLEKENTERLQTCGNQMLTIPEVNYQNSEYEKQTSILFKTPMDFPPDQWLFKVFLGDTIDNTVKIWWEFTVGSFISPRHILTSSQPLITDEGRWYLDKENDINATCYLNETEFVSAVERRFNVLFRHLIVPIEEMEDVDYGVFVTRNSSLEVQKSDIIRVEKGWILRARNQSDVRKMRSPMILELSENVKGVEYPCLVQESEELKEGEETDIYGFREETKPFERTKLLYRRRKIEGFADRWILIDRFYSDNSRGSPMIKTVDGKTTVIGIAGSTSMPYREDDTVVQSYFFDMRIFNKEICAFTGICDPTELHESSPASRTTTVAILQPSDSPTPSWTPTKPSRRPQPTEDPEEIIEPLHGFSSPALLSPDPSTADPIPTIPNPNRTPRPAPKLSDRTTKPSEEIIEHDHAHKDFLIGSGGMELNVGLSICLIVVLLYWI